MDADMVLLHPGTHDVRAIDRNLAPCCQRAVWSTLVEGLGYVPFNIPAKSYAAKLQLADWE